MKQARVMNPQNEYFGMVGKITPVNEYGNVMFYPSEGTPYRVCLKAKDVEVKEEEE